MHMLELSPFIGLGYTKFGNTLLVIPCYILDHNIIRLLLLDLLKTEAQKARKSIGLHLSYKTHIYTITQ